MLRSHCCPSAPVRTNAVRRAAASEVASRFPASFALGLADTPLETHNPGVRLLSRGNAQRAREGPPDSTQSAPTNTVLSQHPPTGPTVLSQHPPTQYSVSTHQHSTQSAPTNRPDSTQSAPTNHPTVLSQHPPTGPTVLSQHPPTIPTVLSQHPPTGPTVLSQHPPTGPTVLSQHPPTGPTVLSQHPPTTRQYSVSTHQPACVPADAGGKGATACLSSRWSVPPWSCAS
jgi:hypothetical protein